MWDVCWVTLSAGTWFPQLLYDPLEVKLVGVSLAVGLSQDQLVIVVSQSTGELIVCHVDFLFLLAPLSCDLVRVNHSEFSVGTFPGDALVVALIIEKR